MITSLRKSAAARFAILAAITLFGTHAPLNAQTEPTSTTDNAALRDARAIVNLSQGDKTIELMLDQLAPVMGQAVLGQLSGDPRLSKLMGQIDAQFAGGREGFVAEFVARFRKRFSDNYPTIAEEGAQIYAREVDPASLRQIREFYESPAGRLLVATSPKVQLALSKVGERLGQEIAVATMTAMIGEIEDRPDVEKAAR